MGEAGAASVAVSVGMSRKHPGSRHYAALNAARWHHARRRTLERAGYRCQRCGVASRLEADHIQPLQRGGAPYSAANLQAICRDCHIEKTASENRRPRTDAENRWKELVRRTYTDESEHI